MGLFSRIITIAVAAVATKKVSEKIIEKKGENKVKEIEAKSSADIKKGEQHLLQMTHAKRLKESKFNSKGELIYTQQCPSCGNYDTTDAKFCSYCGEEMRFDKVKCPNCCRLVPRISKFCNHCGEKISTKK